MSRDPRKGYYDRNLRDSRERDRDIRERRDSRESRDLRDHLRERDLLRSRERDYHSFDKHKRSPDKRRSRSPRKSDKDLLDDNILKEISKLPELSEMWENQGFPPPGTVPPPGFAPPEPNYPPNFQSSYSGIYDDFPSMAPIPTTTQAPPAPEWNQLALPPPPEPLPAPSTFIPNIEDQMKKEAAIESEMRHQKAALSKQREDYIKKAGVLKKELDTLKDQRNELRGDTKRSPSPDTKRFLKENTKLQLEIQNKLKTIMNVVDMLNGIIGEEALAAKIEDDDLPDRPSKRKSRSPSVGNKFNYVYYDPEMHWCRVCNEFPSTAKDYLNHLHSPQHSKMAAAHMEAPWHSLTGVNEGFPSYPSAQTKRTPIKGLQFFVPSTAWYCKLCDVFIGDLHCASAHLKSIAHAKNYSNFVDQNPHWETDWMSDRQKAVEKSRSTTTKVKAEDKSYTAHTITFNKDGFSTKKKDSTPPPEDKKKKDKKKIKKKKRESSSSSDSTSSDSERAKKKKKEKRKSKEGVISELMSVIKAERFTEQDRKIFETLKTRIKEEKRTPDRVVRDRERSIADMQRKIRDSERRESERRETRDREVRDTRDRREEERRRERSPPQDKKDKEKKMPFIGKMPVYKSLTKTKVEDPKKDELKKKDDDDASKKRREEMDAEIQKKVQEFKEKIARAQAEREQQSILGPPPLALPTALGNAMPPPLMAAPPPQPPPPAVVPGLELPKDFQEALNILFPTGEKKPDLATDMFPGFQQGFQSLLGMPPFPPLGMGGMMPPNMPPNMNPNMPPNMNPNMPPQMMMPFNMNHALFQGTQLYDKHVPMQPNNKQRGRSNNYNNNKKNNNYNKNQNQNRKSNQNTSNNQSQKEKEIGERAKEELDDMAMLGIESSDVGAGGNEPSAPAPAPAAASETVKAGNAANK